MVQATQSGTFGAALKAHASVHANGDIGVMMTNTNKNVDANVTVNITGGERSAASGRATRTRRSTPTRTATSTDDSIFARPTGRRCPSLVPRYSSVVVVFPKK